MASPSLNETQVTELSSACRGGHGVPPLQAPQREETLQRGVTVVGVTRPELPSDNISLSTLTDSVSLPDAVGDEFVVVVLSGQQPAPAG